MTVIISIAGLSLIGAVIGLAIAWACEDVRPARKARDRDLAEG